MKEMVYKTMDEIMGEIPNEILELNEYKGYEYKIVSYGTHPCAYIYIPKGHKLYQKEYDDNFFIKINCHGGFTYSQMENSKWVVGWDYAHYYDYSGLIPYRNGKKWTTKEIQDEVKEVINRIVNMEV